MHLPCALSVAGLDPSGGAGLIADARAITAAGAWPCAVAAVLTVQSTAGLVRAIPVSAVDLLAQAHEVFARQAIKAWKTGALGSSANVLAAVSLAESHPDVPLVVDPVMIATRSQDGAKLLDQDALDALRTLCSRAALVTPNLDEAEVLLGRSMRSLDGMIAGAKALQKTFATAVLVKGGHLDASYDNDTSVVRDVLATHSGARVFTSPRVETEFHGGGCALSAFACGALARGHGTSRAVRLALTAISRAARHTRTVGEGLGVLLVR